MIAFKIQLGFIFMFIFFVQASGQNFHREKKPKTDIVSIGFGPSFIYADNGGQYSSFSFKWNPSGSVSYTKRFHSNLGVQFTSGTQKIESGGNPSLDVQEYWKNSGSAFQFKGTAMFMDVLPIINLFPYISHMYRPELNLYGGIGVGGMYVQRKQFFSFDSGESPSPAKKFTAYIPFRSGISYRLGSLSDLALEGTLLFTFSDNLDGNMNFNRFADHLGQAQVTFKRYF